MGDIHRKARKCLKKDVRAMLLHCANLGSAAPVFREPPPLPFPSTSRRRPFPVQHDLYLLGLAPQERMHVPLLR